MAGADHNELVFVPLGGVGEIGMNMAAYGYGPAGARRWVVVDCGVSFGGPDLPGIELVMADPSFLEDQADQVEALILTHAHEDHYGAVLDLWPGFDRPVFATAFAAAMLAAKRAADAITENVPVRIYKPGQPFEVGPFRIEAISMAHSIPESHALLIESPIGRVLHSGDWKIDSNPVVGPPTDIPRLKAIGAEEGPLALICDSTNALKEGESQSEQDVAATLERLIREAPYRVALTTFASNLGRVIAIAQAAERAGRQVVLSGRALHRITTIARELGMLEGVPPFLDQEAFEHLPREKVVLICTGSQGEQRAAIARIANESHPVIALNAGDTVIFSSWAIPGNERAVIDIQNQLIDRGIRLITRDDAPVHVSGHPRRGELRQLYDWLKPDILVPVHGEAMHLEAQAKLGRETGIGTVVSARNGDQIRLFPEVLHSPGEVRAGELYLDGLVLCTPEESGVKGRRRLSFGGMIAVSICMNKQGDTVSGPELEIEGLPEIQDDESVSQIVRQAVKGALRSIPGKRRTDPDVVAEALRRAIRGEVNAYWGKKPNVTVFVHRI